MLQFQRDLDLVEHLDRLGYDEFWCGEHHSSGWEMIASPEMFLAAAGQRSHRIMLGTGVISLPYHHPFNVAQRIAQLDHMTNGRAMFGSGPGALPSDAWTLGIDPMGMTRAEVRARRAGVKLQSALSTRKPSRGKDAARSPFSRATPSSEPSPSR